MGKVGVNIIVLLISLSLLEARDIRTIKSGNIGLRTRVKVIPAERFSIRSGQPDTLYYDDGTPTWVYSPCSGCYGAVRFTPPDPFELRSIYFWLYHINGQGTTDTFWITVYDTLDGNILWGPFGIVEDSAGFWIYQIDLDSTEWLNFNTGEDFYIVIGPQQDWGIYTLVFDDGTQTYRSYINSGAGWMNEDGGDLLLRAGGELLCCDFVDLASLCVYNLPSKFFIREGESITLLSKLTNLTTVSSTFDLYFFIRDTLGNTYFSDIVSGVCAPEETVTVQASIPWSDTAGYYIAIDSIVATGAVIEENLTNNFSMSEIRIYDPSIGNWFQYMDMSPEACYSWIPGEGWATGFRLDCYPVTLDTIAIAFGVSPDTVATDVPVEVWWGMIEPETLLVSLTIDSVFDGVINKIGLDPPIPVDSGMIFIFYPYYVDINDNSVCLLKDDTPPIAGANHCVHVINYQYFANQWWEDNTGDWFMAAFFSECSGVYICGDVNGDGFVNMADLSYLANYLFYGGPSPIEPNCSDVNGDGGISLADLSFLACHLFFNYCEELNCPNPCIN
jgi:hypothetical protein